MEVLKDYSTLLSGILGILSLLITIVSYISNFRSQQSRIKELEEKKFENLLASSDIEKLGNYLDNEIGKLTISDYVDNNKLNNQLDILVDKLTRFIGTENEINEEQLGISESDLQYENEQTVIDIPYSELDSEFQKIVKELEYGEAWNALARLRRHLEIFLREIAIKNKINVEGIYSVTQLINILRHKNVIPIGPARDLKFPVRTSNRAIHGQKLKPGEAEEAVFIAAKAMKEINTPPNNI